MLQNSLEQQANSLQSKLKQTKIQQQKNKEKTAQRRQQGEKIRKSGSQSVLLLDMKKNKAEKRLSGENLQQNKRISNLKVSLKEIIEQKEHINTQKFLFNYQATVNKIRVYASNLILPRGNHKPLSFTINSGEHWHINGNNGSGKSTLLKILSNQLKQKSGEYRLHGNFCYLDQHLKLLNKQLPVVQALYQYNPLISQELWRTHLGALRIRGDKGQELLQHLSGGEQLKVTLLALIQSAAPPDILLLDEPDNHLDIDSKILLERLLYHYEGTLLLVSHDDSFAHNCRITHQINL